MYQEPDKITARTLAIEHAIASLTNERASSPVVRLDSISLLYEHCLELLRKHGDMECSHSFGQEFGKWEQQYKRAIETGKRADQLKVLFLCGPKPSNDLTCLFRLGISGNNVWAVEREREVYQLALDDLAFNEMDVRVFQGNLRDFFHCTPIRFDLVYVDACKPYFGKRSGTSEILKELFLSQRLEALSVLILNHACVTIDGQSKENWAKQLDPVYRYRYFDRDAIPDSKGDLAARYFQTGGSFQEHILAHLEDFYSDFVTTFTMEFAATVAPWWRFWATQKTGRFVAPRDKAQNAIASGRSGGYSDRFDRISAKNKLSVKDIYNCLSMTTLSPYDYPLMKLCLATEGHSDNNPISRLFHHSKLLDTSLSEAVTAMSLLRMADFVPTQNDPAESSNALVGESLAWFIDNFRWLDSEGESLHRLFCDSPMPHLIIDYLVGVQGYPFHSNVAKLRRWKYCAKKTPMLTDVFVFDQTRYLYDFAPSIYNLVRIPEIPQQLILRCCMQLIRSHSIELNITPCFDYSYLEGEREDWPNHFLSARQSL